MSEQAQSAPSDKHRETPETPRDLRVPAALVRTALSSEQTLMSWVRTSLSLFTFGFSIAQFFCYLEQQQEDGQEVVEERDRAEDQRWLRRTWSGQL